ARPFSRTGLRRPRAAPGDGPPRGRPRAGARPRRGSGPPPGAELNPGHASPPQVAPGRARVSPACPVRQDQHMDLGLSDRVYVLTGASRGLGFATAQCLVADGARVVIASRSAERAAAAAASLGGPERAVGIAADLGAPDTPDRLIDAARTAFSRLDGALISVGGPVPGPVSSLSDDQWRDAFETVFLGAVRLARTVANVLPEGGAIGFVLSTSVRMPIPNLGLSNGLRPGLAGVAKDLADEYAPRGVRVVSLLPHRIMTDRNREL